MATFILTKDAFKIHLSPAESRALGRPNLSLDKSRIESFQVVDFPEKLRLGQKVSKAMLFNSFLGEYRARTQRTLVLGKLRGSSETLKISISHPTIDQILVCGRQVRDLESMLSKYLVNIKASNPLGIDTEESSPIGVDTNERSPLGSATPAFNHI